MPTQEGCRQGKMRQAWRASTPGLADGEFNPSYCNKTKNSHLMGKQGQQIICLRWQRLCVHSQNGGTRRGREIEDS